MDLNEYWNLLKYWRATAAGAGHPVPSLDDLGKIARAGLGAWPSELDWSTVEPWRPTIERIRDQKKMGVLDPVGQLPSDLMVPRPVPGAVNPNPLPINFYRTVRDTSASSAPPAPSAPPRAQTPARTQGAPNQAPRPPSVPPAAPTPQRSPGTPSPMPRSQNAAQPPAHGQSPPRSTGASGTPVEAAFAVLSAWREQAMRDHLPLIGSLREDLLHKVARQAGRPRAQIVQILGAQSGFADPMLAALEAAGLRQPEVPAAPWPAAPETSSGPGPVPTDPRTAAAPGRPPEHPPAQPSSHADVVDGTGFHPINFLEPLGEFAPLTVEPQVGPDGTDGWRVSWAPAAENAPVVIYRVVLNDYQVPFAPEDGELITATTATAASVHRPFETAVRHVQVWSNSGPTVVAAKHAQPRKVAEAVMVATVQEVLIREEQGTVIGQWSALPGTLDVHVYRSLVRGGGFGVNNPNDRIQPAEDLMGGFVDTPPERGQRYLYQIYSLAEVDGVSRMSPAVTRPVLSSAPVVAVSDLAIDLRLAGDVDVFDLVWSQPPAGKVIIYRTKDGPLPGVEDRLRPASALPQANLSDDDRLAHPVSAATGGRVGMRNVPWPPEWNRAYFTPVTLWGEQALVGRTISATRAKSIRDAEIVERVNKQILTFTWPAGASSVLVFSGPPGGDADQARQSHPQEINRQTWEQLGGMEFPRLPDRGCRLHLVPVAFDAGRRVEGGATSVDYPWLLRIWYQVQIKRSMLRKATAVLVSIATEFDTDAPPMVLIHNPARMPLDIGDGTVLPVVIDGDQTSTPGPRLLMERLSPTSGAVKWRAEVAGLTGFVRLFVDLPLEVLSHVALLDPGASSLTLA